jgi:hypothetical protein
MRKTSSEEAREIEELALRQRLMATAANEPRDGQSSLRGIYIVSDQPGEAIAALATESASV